MNEAEVRTGSWINRDPARLCTIIWCYGTRAGAQRALIGLAAARRFLTQVDQPIPGGRRDLRTVVVEGEGVLRGRQRTGKPASAAASRHDSARSELHTPGSTGPNRHPDPRCRRPTPPRAFPGRRSPLDSVPVDVSEQELRQVRERQAVSLSGPLGRHRGVRPGPTRPGPSPPRRRSTSRRRATARAPPRAPASHLRFRRRRPSSRTSESGAR